MSIDVRLLKPFLATAEKLSFTKAADEIGVSQPRLSLLIKKLEDQLGFALFVRAPHHVQLSREGGQFLDYAKEIDGALKHFDRSVWDLRANIRARLRIGSPMSTTVRYPDRFEILDQFAARHPAIRLRMEGGYSNHLVERLRQGKLDLTFAMVPFEPAGLVALPLESSQIFLAIPSEHPLADCRQVTLEQMAGVKVAVMPAFSGTSYLLHSNTVLQRAGAVLIEAYEPQHNMLLHFAARKRVCVIVHKWRGQMQEPNQGYPDMVLRPLIGVDASMHVHLLKLPGPQPAPVEWFWKLAQQFASREASEMAHS
jgi:DNA-binding transcriptional LysR family regulator